jgi:nucleotide-binding universal stress UspA family protein
MKAATAKTQVRFDNILFATDFSAAAAHAIPYVKRIAKHYEAKLVVLNVRPPAVNPMTPPASWAVDLEAEKALNEQHREELQRVFAGIPTHVVIEEGGIHSRLQAAMERYHTDLVVIGTRGRTGVWKLFLGSVAEEIFRTLSCPVLTVGPQADPPIERDGQVREILYATDFSPESKAGAAYAIALAQEFQARLVLLHVIPDLRPGDLVSVSDLTESSRALLHNFVSAEAQAWCKPEYVVEQGNPAEKILDFARVRESDLIVLGVRRETGVAGAATHLPFATTHRVVSLAKCPVLTVRG